jgi:DNA-binding transcriptional ArsR family regulator
VISPMIEFGSALHVLGDPGHHGADAWAARVRDSMSRELAGQTDAWSWIAQAIRAAPLVTASAEDFEARVAELRAMPPRQLAAQLLRAISRAGSAAAALRWSRARGPELAALADALAGRPGEAVPGFLGFLERSWREWFSAEWARVRPVLAARAREFTDLAGRQGATAALASTDAAVTAVAGGVVLTKVQSRRHDVARRGLLVAPSAFIRPHLYVADVPGRPLLVIHPALRGGAVPTAAELLRRLEVAAHPGRLEVARAIATEPRTAGEIAALWGMDATLVNRHLRALAAAGLAATTRRGRFVQYRLDVAVIEALGTDLVAMLLR